MARQSREAAAGPSRFPADLLPMEARSADRLPEDDGWQFEPKWDGFRCLAFRDGAEVELRAKSGKPLARYFPDVAAMLRSLPASRFVVDGELVIAVDDGLSFDALQLRLHPAESRVRKLAAETPASLIAFDMLMTPKGEILLDAPLERRRAALEAFAGNVPAGTGLTLSPFTRDRSEADSWLGRTDASVDGVVAKRLDGRYEPGERSMIKVKRLKTADCVVGGFRYGRDNRLVGSLLLGLFDDDGLLDHVGYTSTISNDERPALTKRLEAMAGPPGFTGKAPGGPSRWSTDRTGQWEPLRHELVVEVRYDHVTGDRFRHGTKLMRWRPDKSPRQCTHEQIASPVSTARRLIPELQPPPIAAKSGLANSRGRSSR